MIETMAEKLKGMTFKIDDVELNRNKKVMKSHIL